MSIRSIRRIKRISTSYFLSLKKGLFLQVHKLPKYNSKDIDIGVPKKIFLSQEKHYTFQDKEDMLTESLYNLIFRLFDSGKQFGSPDEALQHPFLQESGSNEIERNSDI